MRDYDGILLDQIIAVVKQGPIAVQADELVWLGQRKGIVEPGRLTNADAYGLEALRSSTVKYLQAAMRADGGDGEILLVIPLQDLHDIFLWNHVDNLNL